MAPTQAAAWLEEYDVKASPGPEKDVPALRHSGTDTAAAGKCSRCRRGNVVHVPKVLHMTVVAVWPG